jgi:hypothetical protein
MMKFLCMGYIAEQSWNVMSEQQQNACVEECFAYDDVLRRNGHFTGGEALRDSSTAKTLRFVDGKLLITDGPFAETKEQIGGLLMLEAESMEQAVELISRHPGVRLGPFEIRAVDEEFNAMIAERTAAARVK